jgi:SAM-dependent methyltransferase
MDEATFRAYATHASEIARRHRSVPREQGGVERHLARAFDPDDRILDIGTGAGGDLAFLVSEGREAYGVEPVAEMRAEAVRAHPELSGRLFEGSLPDGLPDLEGLGGPFDGVLCSAVLQHLPRAALFDAVFSLRRLLRPGGRVLVSIPTRRDDLDEEGRDGYGRYFSGVQAGELDLLFQRTGFRTLGRWEDGDSLGHGAVRWATLLFDLAHHEQAESPRPLDRIEGVLRGDRKVATYKLALLRALTDIATTQARRARWIGGGRVAVPIDAVAELWISYYWPLFESRIFLPQMQGEAREQQHKLGFARELEGLMDHFRRSGGLPGFLEAWHSGRLSSRGGDETGRELLGAALGKLRTAIRTGPVHHAGRSTSGSLFDYDAAARAILVDEPLWQEITLTSHWVRDSLLVRWAELTKRLATAGSGETATPQQTMDCALRVLLETPEPERDTKIARKVFETIPTADRICVWSARQLRSDFDVDHVIPFALWQNNDLWNLLPAARSVNRDKSDHLPERRLLRERRPVIRDYWQVLHDAHPRRFSTEIGRLTGTEDHTGAPDLEAGFEALCESIEITALQRSCERWAPEAIGGAA